MNSSKSKPSEEQLQSMDTMQQKIALLEKQLKWEKLRADALDTMINIADKATIPRLRKASARYPLSLI